MEILKEFRVDKCEDGDICVRAAFILPSGTRIGPIPYNVDSFGWSSHFRTAKNSKKPNAALVACNGQIFLEILHSIDTDDEVILRSLEPALDTDNDISLDRHISGPLDVVFPVNSEEFRQKFAAVNFNSTPVLPILSATPPQEICLSCGLALPDKNRLNEHLISCHLENGASSSDREFRCDQCPKVFSWKSNLIRHQVAHDESRRYVCESCRKVFTDPSNLQRHIRSQHIGARSHACSECGKTFATSSGLKQHTHIHSSVKPFRCEVCHKAYTQFSNLCRHKRMHATCRMQIKCHKCGQAFATVTSLTKHKRFCDNHESVQDDATLTPVKSSVSQRGRRSTAAVQTTTTSPTPRSTNKHLLPFFSESPTTSLPFFPAFYPYLHLQQPISANQPPANADTGKTTNNNNNENSHSENDNSVGGKDKSVIVKKEKEDDSDVEPDVVNDDDEDLEDEESDEQADDESSSTDSDMDFGRGASYRKHVSPKHDVVCPTAATAPRNSNLAMALRIQTSEAEILPFDLSNSKDHVSGQEDRFKSKSNMHDKSEQPLDLRISCRKNFACFPSPQSAHESTPSEASPKREAKSPTPISSFPESPKAETKEIDTPVSTSNRFPVNYQRNIAPPYFDPITLYNRMQQEKNSLLSPLSALFPNPERFLNGQFDASRYASFLNPLLNCNSSAFEMMRAHMAKLAATAVAAPPVKEPPCPTPPVHHTSPHGLKNKERYSCKFCGKMFPRSANLTRHLRTHTGEQPYKCKYCERSFSISSNLQRHVRNIHNKEKPFKCSLCDRCFGQQTNLDRHLKKHETDGPALIESDAPKSLLSHPAFPMSDRDREEQAAYFAEIRNFIGKVTTESNLAANAHRTNIHNFLLGATAGKAARDSSAPNNDDDDEEEEEDEEEDVIDMNDDEDDSNEDNMDDSAVTDKRRNSSLSSLDDQSSPRSDSTHKTSDDGTIKWSPSRRPPSQSDQLTSPTKTTEPSALTVP